MEKHEEICIKTSQKKRKTFDMTKARVKVIFHQIHVSREENTQNLLKTQTQTQLNDCALIDTQQRIIHKIH